MRAVSRPSVTPSFLVLVALGTALAAVGGWRYARASAPVSGPIVLISIDTLRADHLPAYGYTQVQTPAIDALAADGVVFERAYSHAPQTLPAHAALLSGRLPFETGVRDNVGFTVEAGERLLPQMLRDRGLRTGGVVSAYVLRKETGIGQGFDFFDGDMPPSSPELTHRPGAARRHRRPSRSPSAGSTRSGPSRVFLFLHLYEPHKPYAPPERFAAYAPYDGEIAYADEIVGRLVHYLKTHQLYDRSTIVLLSDHGEGLGDHGEQEHGLFVYDEAIHVPLIIKQAGNAGAGRRVADARPARRSRADDSGSREGAGPGEPARPIAQAAARRHRPPAGAAGLLGGAVRALPLRLERADRADRRALSVHQGAARGAVRSRSSDPHERSNIAADHAAARDGAARRARSPHRRARPFRRPPSCRPTRASGCRRSAMSDRRARRPRGRWRRAAGSEGQTRDPRALSGSRRPRRRSSVGARDRQAAAHPAAGAGNGGCLESTGDVRDPHRSLRSWRSTRTSISSSWSRPIRTDIIGAAATDLHLRRLDDARAHAELAAQVAAPRDIRSRASAHELLAKIALARHDADDARAEAGLVRQIDPRLPMPAYVAGRLLYDQGKYDEALPLFQQAVSDLGRSGTPQMTDVHFYTADTLGRLERYPEAEKEFLEELRYFPQNSRARAGLAMLYQETDRADLADAAIADLLRTTPTPDAYALAARLYTMFGDASHANAIRAEARRTFVEPARPGGRPARH